MHAQDTMRPQVPYDQINKRRSRDALTPQQNWQSNSERTENLGESSHHHKTTRRRSESHQMLRGIENQYGQSTQQRGRRKTLSAILESNQKILNEFRDPDRFNVKPVETESVSSSIDMARAQTPPPETTNAGFAEHQYYKQCDPRLSGHTMSSEEAAGPVPTPRQGPSISSVPRPRTLQYWAQELEKEEQKKQQQKQTYIGSSRSGSSLALSDLPNNALADDVASPTNSVSGHKKSPNAEFRHHFASQHAKTGSSFRNITHHSFLPETRPAVATAVALPTKIPSVLEVLLGQNNFLKSCTNPTAPSEEFKPPPPNLNDSYGYARTYANPISKERIQAVAPDTDSTFHRYIPAGENNPRHHPSSREYEQTVIYGNPSQTSTLYNEPTIIERPPQPKRRARTPDALVGSRSTCYTPTTAVDSRRRRSTPEFSNRTSPTMSQVQQELWSGDSVDEGGTQNDVNERATRTSTLSDAIATCASSSSPAIYPKAHHATSNSIIDDFDPFDVACQAKSEKRANYTAAPLMCRDITPRVTNHEQRRHSLLEPSQRDTRPTRVRPQSLVGNATEANNMLPQCTNPLVALSERSEGNVAQNYPPLPDQNDSLDNLILNMSASSLSAGVVEPYSEKSAELKNPSRQDRVHQNALRNVEILRELEQEGNNSTTANSNTTNTLPQQPNGALMHTTTSKSPVPSKVKSQKKKTPTPLLTGPNMYVAYSRFGLDPREVLQLCEHPVRPKPASSNELSIQVLAASISTTDCEIRRGEWNTKLQPNKIQLEPYLIPGTTIVGIVAQEDKRRRGRHGFSNGDMVLGLITTGGNAKFTCVARDQLISLPKSTELQVDPGMAVCLGETYLTAFQALTIGLRGSLRYRETALRGKSILILGGASTLGHAMLEVARAGGASYSYALAKDRQYDEIRKRGGIPLPKDPQRWLTLIGRQIDLMIVVGDYNGLYTDSVTQDHFKAVCEDGQVVFIGPPGVNLKSSNTNGGSSNASRLVCRSIKSSLLERSHFLNIFDMWETDSKQSRRDLEHLVKLLQEGWIKPLVLERVPLSKVPRVHSILETKKVPGFIVCTPWILEQQQQPQQLQKQHGSTSSSSSSSTTVTSSAGTESYDL